MQYRHAFHAGNFADVHKHIALLQLIDALQKKAKGFLYMDTHAGEGAYDLGGADARQGGESDAGIGRLEEAIARAPDVTDPAIRRYLDCIARLRKSQGEQRLYPGSPLLAIASLRAVDAALCVESQAPIARALTRTLEHHAAQLALRPRIIHGDAWHEIKAHLPPASRRGLMLIDPPYESRGEEQQIATALAEGLQRFETGVFAVWYPIKRRHESDGWLARVLDGINRPALTAEFYLHVPDHAAGLNGSGMLVINPPWGFDSAIHAWQVQLEELLGAAGGSRVHWLIREA